MKNKYESFKQIIRECNYDNTYKMSWKNQYNFCKYIYYIWLTMIFTYDNIYLQTKNVDEEK